MKTDGPNLDAWHVENQKILTFSLVQNLVVLFIVVRSTHHKIPYIIILSTHTLLPEIAISVQ